MDKYAEIKKLLKSFGIEPNLPITATVVSTENDTCTVKLQDGFILSDIRLKATISDNEDRFLIVPKIGSEVIIMSQTGALSGLMVLKVDAVENIQYKKGAFEFVIDGATGKVTLKKEDANFGTLVSDLIKEISNAIILTPVGPGQIASTTKAKLTALDTKFKTILNTD